MSEFNEIERRVLGALDGRERLKALLRDAGFATITDFARKRGLWAEQVSMCLSGSRPSPDVRDALAEELRITRAQVDGLIDGAATEGAA